MVKILIPEVGIKPLFVNKEIGIQYQKAIQL